jgi:plasmid stabilization system protein ParE
VVVKSKGVLNLGEMHHRRGLRKITAGRHTIFYMADEREVQIVRIKGQH